MLDVSEVFFAIGIHGWMIEVRPRA